MTQLQLERLCREWKRVLRLDHWETRVELASGAAIGHDRRADCEASFEHLCATIRVHDGRCFADGPWPYDPEELLVHELLHLFPALWYPDDCEASEQLNVEQTVNVITSALLGLKRRGTRSQ